MEWIGLSAVLTTDLQCYISASGELRSPIYSRSGLWVMVLMIPNVAEGINGTALEILPVVIIGECVQSTALARDAVAYHR